MVNVILQSIPSISVNKPIASAIPCAVVIILGMVKEVILEWNRHTQDKKANAQTIEKLQSVKGLTEYQVVRVDQLRVGDLIKLKDE